jgi:hypothetical protein
VSGSPPPKRPTLLQEIGSVLASFFGVQSSRNRQRDFTQGSPVRFVVLGLLMTAGFVLLVYTVVQLVIRGTAT